MDAFTIGLGVAGAAMLFVGARLAQVREEQQVGRVGREPLYENVPKYKTAATLLLIVGLFFFMSALGPMCASL